MIRDFPTQQAMVAYAGVNGSSPSNDDLVQESLDFVYDLAKDFESRDKLFKLIDDVIFLDQKVHIPENFKNTALEVRTPLPSHIANQITAALTINNPRVHFDPTEFGDPGYEQSGIRQRFFESAWEKQQREKKRRLYRLFMYNQVTKGIAILKTTDRKRRAWAKYGDYSTKLLGELDGYRQSGVLDQENFTRLFDGKTEDYKKGLPYPIETVDVPPETFYYQMGNDGFTRCVEIKNVPYFDTLKRYDAGLTATGKARSFDDMTAHPLPESYWHKCYGDNDRRTLQMVEIWDAYSQRIIIRGPGDIPSKGAGFVGSGLLVKDIPHNFGDAELGTLRGPYFMASGLTTSSSQPERAHMSVLFAYIHLFPLLNALMTMQAQAAFTFAFPAYRRTRPNNFGLIDTPFGYDARDIVQNRQQIVPGAIFPDDIMPMDQPRTSVDLDKAIQFVTQMIQRVLPDTVQGMISGETAGYAINQASHLATLAWTPLTDNAQETLSDRVGFESELIETNIGEIVYVRGSIPRPKSSQRSLAPYGDYKNGWIGLGPKHLNGNHNYTVTLEPASINTDTLQLRNIKEELDMRLIDPNEAIRMRGRNPVEVERAWLLYELKQDPIIRNQLKQRIYQQLSTMEQDAMRGVPPEGQPTAPTVPTSNQPVGAAPGIPQGAPTTGFVPPSPSPAQAAQAPAPQPTTAGTPGTPTGAPAGLRGAPALHSPLPGE